MLMLNAVEASLAWREGIEDFFEDQRSLPPPLGAEKGN